MILLADQYQIPIRPETEHQCFVHGDHPNYSARNVTVFQESIPYWVTPIDPPAPVILDDKSNPNLLGDYQFDIASQSDFIHQVFHIWTAFDALNLANIEISFDPNMEKLTLHECKVFRNGRWIDKLDMNELRVIQREEDLDEMIYNGDLSALIFVEDVRPGDLLDFSYTLTGQKDQIFSGYYPLQFHERWEKVFGRVVKDPAHSYQFNLAPYEWNSYLTEDETEWSWTIEPCLPYEREPDQPPGYCYRPMLEITELTDWHNAAMQEVDFYRLNENFAKDPEANALVNSWKEESSDLEEMAIQALRFVQDEVRYLGIEEGLSKVHPTDPVETLKRRFGDCKDKTQLLRSFLALLGISSEACLVHTHWQKGVTTHLPSLLVFNHVITRIDLPDRIVFADPTVMCQGGPLGQLDFTYGAGLVVSEKTTQLTEIPMPIVHPEIDCQTNFDVQKGNQVEMTLSAHFYGSKANSWRYRIQEYGLKKFSEYYETVIKSQLGSFQVLTPLKIDDDRHSNHIHATAKLLLKNPWQMADKKREKYFVFLPLFIEDFFDQDVDPNRKTPLALPQAHVKESIIVQGGTIVGSSDQIDHEAFSLKALLSSKRVDYDLSTYLDALPADELIEYAQKLEEAEETIEVLIKAK